jgi:Ca-activated chloride channel family protein
VKDDRGAVVLSRLNSATLQELAQVTSGAYADASTWVDLPALLRKTVDAGRKGEFSEKNTARMIERYQWFLAPGLLLLLISFWAEFPVRPRERSLPLGKATGQKAAIVASVAALFFVGLGAPPTMRGAEAPSETLAKPLTTTVARLAEQGGLSAKDCSELAQTTITYGQRVKSAQQRPPENVIRDALQAVDLGEKIEAKAADWPRVRQELEDLLKKEEPPPEDKKQNQDQQKQDQQKNEKQNQDQQQQKQDQQKSDQQKQNEQKEQEQKQPQQENKDAFGDMKEPKEKKPQPPPQPGNQKVGGQQDKKAEEQSQDPELAMPLQKLDQVRNQDSPAKLQQLMQGQQQKPKPTAKDW